MMPRERISFERFTSYKDKTGQKVKEWVAIPELSNIPVERRKRRTSSDIVMNAKEEFVDLSITFWMRYDASITDDLRIKYNGKVFNIIDVDRSFKDNSCLISCVKENG